MAVGSSRSEEFKANRLKVLARDGYVCTYCGREATEADHVDPTEVDGKKNDSMTNLVAACKSCNSSKGNRTQTRMNWYDREWLDSL